MPKGINNQIVTNPLIFWKLLKFIPFTNLYLRNNLRKTKRGEGVFGNLRFYLRKTKGGREGVWRCFSKGKTERTWCISIWSLMCNVKLPLNIQICHYCFPCCCCCPWCCWCPCCYCCPCCCCCCCCCCNHHRQYLWCPWYPCDNPRFLSSPRAGIPSSSLLLLV